MSQWFAQYKHYNTILIAESRDDARKQAVFAFGIDPFYAKDIAVVPRTIDGRVG